jgi:hypothetical protein
MYIKSGLPEEPKLKTRMFVDVLAYKSHKPYMQLSMRDEWYNNMGPSKQQKDILLKTYTADTGAQCFLSSLAWGWACQISSSLKPT